MNKGLVAPETQLFDASKLINFVNGLVGLSALGLTDCEWGVGDSRSRLWLPDYPDGGKFDCQSGPDAFNAVPLRLLWKPPSWGGNTNVRNAITSEVIDDIDLLLTGGRLHSANKAILQTVYDNANSGSDPDNNALSAVIQHFAAVPEFHITSNLVDSSSTTLAERDAPDISLPPNPPPVEGYKAIVYLYMAGAVSCTAMIAVSANTLLYFAYCCSLQSDSFSMLAPVDGCGDLHTQYLNVRGDIAIQSANLLHIDASSSNQPCSSFGLHPSLQNIQSLYTQGHASWVSNVGPLVKPITKAEFEAGTVPVPQALVSLHMYWPSTFHLSLVSRSLKINSFLLLSLHTIHRPKSHKQYLRRTALLVESLVELVMSSTVKKGQRFLMGIPSWGRQRY